MITAQLLRNARHYLEEHGWIQNTLGHPGGPRCLLGAIFAVNHDHSITRSGLNRALGFSASHRTASHRTPFVAWNDEPGRTIEDVYALLDQVIAALEREEAARELVPA